MSAGLQPTSGARFELDLQEAEGGAARYLARVHLPGGQAAFELRINAAGDCTIEAGEAGAGDAGAPGGADALAAPAWARAHLIALGKLLGREAKREGSYRRRLLRWRQEA